MPRLCPECGQGFGDDVTRCPDDGAPTFAVIRPTQLVGRTVEGQTIDGRYTLVQQLSIGDAGTTYLAHQHSMNRDVVLKVLRPDLLNDEKAMRGFLREARAASKLNNPHTVMVFDFGQTSEGLLYITMERLSGRSLEETIRTAGPMSMGRAVRIIEQVLDSLDEAHSAGMVHGDLNPRNVILLEKPGARDFAKVTGYGVVRIQDIGHVTVTGLRISSPVHASPEMARGQATDARSDLYSAGVILFEMLAGRPPFEGDTPVNVLIRKLSEPPPAIESVNPAASVPPAMKDLLAGLMAERPDQRPATAAAVKAAIHAIPEMGTASYTGVSRPAADSATTIRVPYVGPVEGEPVALDRAEPVVERIEARAEVFDLPSDAVGLAWWKWAGLAALVAAMAAAVVLIWSNGRETTTLDHGAALAAEDIHPLDPVAAVPDAAPAADFADVMAAASAPAVMTPVLLPGPARTGAAPARYLRHPDSDLSTMLKKGRRTGKDEIQLKKPRL